MPDSAENFNDFNFGGANQPLTPPAPTTFYGVYLRDLSLDVEPVPFVYGRTLIRGMLSVLGGSGGVGKTAYATTVLTSIAYGKPLLATGHDDEAHHIYDPKGKVMLYSLEDPMDMLIRQVSAVIKLHHLNPRELFDRVILQSGRDLPLTVARQDDRGRLVRCDINPIVDYLLENNIDVLAVDPYANSFDGGEGAESSSDSMKIICDQWRQIAHKANLAGWLLHHFRKGGVAGDADAFRGSTAIQNSARVMETMTTMTKDEASELGIDESERRGYARVENAKANLTAASEGRWYRFNPVPLGNPTTKYPKGDIIGVVVPWKPEANTLSWAKVDGALNQISIGVGDSFYSTSPNTGDRWAGKVIMAWTSCNRKKAKEHLGSWLASGILFTEEVKTKARNRQEVLRVDLDAKARLQQDMTGEK